ncbi:hypothetical protein J3F84DRAFT_368670 [Trichoderma pleuroticola]
MQTHKQAQIVHPCQLQSKLPPKQATEATRAEKLRRLGQETSHTHCVKTHFVIRRLSLPHSHRCPDIPTKKLGKRDKELRKLVYQRLSFPPPESPPFFFCVLQELAHYSSLSRCCLHCSLPWGVPREPSHPSIQINPGIGDCVAAVSLFFLLASSLSRQSFCRRGLLAYQRRHLRIPRRSRREEKRGCDKVLFFSCSLVLQRSRGGR